MALAFVIHEEGGVRYALQDANYNLVGWTKAGSAVAAQYVYGPYGDLRAADLRPAETDWPAMGVGHQGLFFIRFDSNPEDPPLAVGARGLYYNRNRWYSPELGRFIQRDVNETALPIITALAFNAQTLDALLGAFDGQALYGDGMSLYAYASANPVNHRDPAGLMSYNDLTASAGYGYSLYGTAMSATNSALGFIQGVVGEMAAQAYLTSVAIITACATYGGGIDYGMYPAIADELARFKEWTSNHAENIRSAFDRWVNNASNPSPGDPWNQWGRFNHTLDKAGKWFGVAKENLSSAQIQQWARHLEHVSRSERFVRQNWRGTDTIVKWARIDGKYLAVRINAQTDALITAMIYTNPQSWMQ